MEGSGKNIFGTMLFSTVMIGVPFCIYKFLFGVLALRAHHESAGWIIIFWALADTLFILVRILFLLAKKAPPLEPCTIGQLGRLFKMAHLFLAIDKVLVFSIICFVLWSRWVTVLKAQERILWYCGTTINFVCLSIIALWTETRSMADGERKVQD